MIHRQEESLFFIKQDTVLSGSKPFNIVSLQDFLKSKISSVENKIYYDDLVRELRRFEIFLIKEENNCYNYIKVISNYEVY